LSILNPLISAVSVSISKLFVMSAVEGFIRPNRVIFTTVPAEIPDGNAFRKMMRFLALIDCCSHEHVVELPVVKSTHCHPKLVELNPTLSG
jgi:hypothetical protein